MKGHDSEAMRYRLEVGGSVGASWCEWFEADTVTPAGDNTVLELRVADRAELYGRLRRIHDLNLRLISVTQLPNIEEKST
jgi:hypothetical protein